MKTIHDPRYDAFIDALIRVRLNREITQMQLAAVLGKPQSYVAKVENLDRRLDVVETRDWLMALNIAPPEFMSLISWWSLTSSGNPPSKQADL